MLWQVPVFCLVEDTALLREVPKAGQGEGIFNRVYVFYTTPPNALQSERTLRGKNQ